MKWSFVGGRGLEWGEGMLPSDDCIKSWFRDRRRHRGEGDEQKGKEKEEHGTHFRKRPVVVRVRGRLHASSRAQARVCGEAPAPPVSVRDKAAFADDAARRPLLQDARALAEHTARGPLS